MTVRSRRSRGPLAAAGGWVLLGVAAVGIASPGAGQEPLTWGEMQAAVRDLDVPAGERIPYGPGDERRGELSLPPGSGPHPVAVVLHGGCWLSIADGAYVRELARELNRLGWATWMPDFHTIDEAEGQWPGILTDVARGTDHLRELARTRPLDLGRVVAVGHSSGGHLALWLAGRGAVPTGSSRLPGGDGRPVEIRGVVGLAPIAALEDFQARSDRCGPDIVTELLGGGDLSPAERARRRAVTDPAAVLPLGVPQLLVMGAEDGIVPEAHGRDWARRAEAAGDAVEVRVVPGAGHFELVAPWTSPWPEVEETLRAFLEGLHGG